MHRPVRIVLICAALAAGAGNGAAQCPPMVPNQNVFFTWLGAVTSCSYIGGRCETGEVITFNTAAFSYDFGCAVHTFQWDFGDATSANGKTVTHTYAAAGVYTVTLTITNPQQTVMTTATVPVDPAPRPPPPVPLSTPLGDCALTFALAALGVAAIRSR